MSWQQYITDQLMVPGEMHSAAIYALDGSPWACEGPILPTPEEARRLVNILLGKEKDFSGMKINGQSFLFVKQDEGEGSLMLSRLGATKETDKHFISAYLSKSCMVVGVVVGNYKLGNCSTVVCRLRDYLKQAGY